MCWLLLPSYIYKKKTSSDQGRTVSLPPFQQTEGGVAHRTRVTEDNQQCGSKYKRTKELLEKRSWPHNHKKPPRCVQEKVKNANGHDLQEKTCLCSFLTTQSRQLSPGLSKQKCLLTWAGTAPLETCDGVSERDTQRQRRRRRQRSGQHSSQVWAATQGRQNAAKPPGSAEHWNSLMFLLFKTLLLPFSLTRGVNVPRTSPSTPDKERLLGWLPLLQWENTPSAQPSRPPSLTHSHLWGRSHHQSKEMSLAFQWELWRDNKKPQRR